ncbi:MAG TPA: hypothetical protein VFO41_08915 [Alphaproteobacteria bacterium]|nr:hypothetical protein [Alphaproteobacteria bacterium]
MRPSAKFPVPARRAPVRPAGAASLVAAALLAGACATSGAGAGGGIGTAVTVATANPFLGAGAGYAAEWATGRVADYQTAQLRAAIAEAGGAARPDETVPWVAGENLPVGQARGTLTVTGTNTDKAKPCKDVRFTILEGREAELGDYAGTVCRSGDVWQLAEARPASADWTPPEGEEPPAETPAKDRREETGPRPFASGRMAP